MYAAVPIIFRHRTGGRQQGRTRLPEAAARVRRDRPHVSSQPGPTYATAMFAKHPDAEGVTNRAFTDAMNKLFTAKRIKVDTHGSGAKARSHLVEMACG